MPFQSRTTYSRFRLKICRYASSKDGKLLRFATIPSTNPGCSDRPSISCAIRLSSDSPDSCRRGVEPPVSGDLALDALQQLPLPPLRAVLDLHFSGSEGNDDLVQQGLPLAEKCQF